VHGFLDGDHAPDPPRGEFVHLRRQPVGERVEITGSGTVARKRWRDRGRPGGGHGARIAVRVQAEYDVEVGGPIAPDEGVDLRPRGAEARAPEHPCGGLPPRRLSAQGPPTHLLAWTRIPLPRRCCDQRKPGRRVAGQMPCHLDRAGGAPTEGRLREWISRSRPTFVADISLG
jgi:hypothetical protein